MVEPVDLLAFGPHPDDVELWAGGLLIKLVSLDYRVAIVDLTRGEIGTRGTPDARLAEAEAARGLLGASYRENLGLPDGGIESNNEAKRAVIESIRRFRPKVLLAPHVSDVHPDHANAGRLIKEAMFLSGLEKMDADGAPHRARQTWFYMCHEPFLPSFIVDITNEFPRKLAAIRCFSSQLHQKGSAEGETDIASPDYLERLEARLRYFGSLIQARYGEPYLTSSPVRVSDPLSPWMENGEAR